MGWVSVLASSLLVHKYTTDFYIDFVSWNFKELYFYYLFICIHASVYLLFHRFFYSPSWPGTHYSPQWPWTQGSPPTSQVLELWASQLSWILSSNNFEYIYYRFLTYQIMVAKNRILLLFECFLLLVLTYMIWL